MDRVQGLFSFPNPVNEKAARVVAGAVAVVCVIGLATSAYWLFIPLAPGFWARVLTGPTLSPLGRLATSVIAPRLGDPAYVSGPPKRFAQGMGAAFTTAGAVLAVGLGLHGAGDGLYATMIVAASLESVFRICVGCRLFAVLMATGVVPQEVCAECADVRLHWGRTAA